MRKQLVPVAEYEMVKVKKMILASVTAAAMATAMLPAMAFAADIAGTSSANTTGETTVKYQVSEGYAWSIPTEIDFGSNVGVNKTKDVRTTGTTGTTQNVEVTKNIIPDGKKLGITVAGNGTDGAFTIANGDTKLGYTIKKAGDDANIITTGGNVLTVSAGTNTGEQGLVFTLTTANGENVAEVAGTYEGTATFTASVE